MGKKAVHFGAGNIGRGFVAEFLHKSGYEVVFADVMDSVITALQNTKSYKVLEIGSEGEKTSVITNYRAINSKTHEADVIKEISTADILTCAVGPNILKFIAPVIGKALTMRDEKATPLAVIACENAINATDTLAGHIKDHTEQHARAEYANSAIDRIVPAQDPDAGLNVKLESFYEWVVDQTPFKHSGHPKLDGVKWVGDLTPYIERKLFTVNTGHAAAAYWGHNKGVKTIHDALDNKEIHDEVRKTLQETSRLITDKHAIEIPEQAAYVEKIIERISNPYLADVVERVGRAPLRKLSRKERFIGPAAELAEKGEKVDALLEAAEMAFRFQNVEGDEESVELAKILKESSAKDAAEKITGLEPSHPLFDRVVAIITKVQG
jgi:mannitol-1-phosphate 5-dehydrogenase